MLQPDYRPPFYLLATPTEWFVIAGATILGTALFSLCWPDAGIWLVLGMGLTMVVVGHMCMTAGRHVAFPDLVALASCGAPAGDLTHRVPSSSVEPPR